MNARSAIAKAINPNTLDWCLRIACITRLLPLFLLLVLPASVKAQDYGTYTNNGTVTITQYTGAGTNVTIPSAINGLPVVSIGTNAFANCAALTSVVIPSSVTTIESNAFTNCASLVNVAIPSTVTNIGVYAFYGNSMLAAITVQSPNPSYSSLDGVLFNSSRTMLVQYPVGKIGSFSIPSSVTNVGAGAFAQSTNVASIVIPRSVTGIGDMAFQGCSNLASLVIPTSVEYLGAGVFDSCISLTNIVIPSSVTSLGNWEFNYCTNLTAIVLPSSITNIGAGVFASCIGLTNVVIPASVTGVGACAFSNCLGLASVVIPSSVNNLGSGVFFGCTNLTSIVIPSSVTNLGDWAFASCSGLARVAIPSSITSIAPCTFSNCVNLDNVIIPSSVTNIGDGAFLWCMNLANIYFQGDTPGIGVNVFEPLAYAGTINSMYYDGNTNWASATSVLPNWGSYVNLSILPWMPFSYTNSGGTVTILGYTGFVAAVSVPGKLYDANVTRIASGAFAGSILTSVVIPSSVTNIGRNAFSACSVMTEIRVDAPNTNYTSIDGVLLNHDETTLIQCPGAKAGFFAIPGSVTNIIAGAFQGCSNLTSVTIPGSVASVGDSAFSGCTNLTSLVIPGSLTALGSSVFSGCTSLTNLMILSGVTSIGSYAFDNCGHLASVSIPDSVISISTGAFQGCSSLASALIPGSVANIGSYAFSACISLTNMVIPSTVTTVGAGAFQGCSGLTNMVIPDSISIVADYVFSSCTNLTSIVIPASVTAVGGWAFSYCTSLTNVVMPAGITNIGDYAFDSCSSLSNLTVPANVVRIGGGAFSSCTNLTSVVIPDRVTSVGDYAFSSCSSLNSLLIGTNVVRIGGGAFDSCSSLTNVTVPDSVSDVGNYAFSFCSSLVSAGIGAGVTNIGDGAFSSCSNLVNVAIGANVARIGDSAFDSCSRLGSIMIPASVTKIGRYAFSVSGLVRIEVGATNDISIGDYAFSSCSSLAGVYFRGNAPSPFGTGVFYNDNSATVYYLSGHTGWVPPLLGGRPLSLWSLPDFMYAVNNGTITITKYTGTNSNVTVPDMFIGLTISGIGSNAFNYCNNITNIVIPASVTSIWASAFDYCTSLATITASAGNPVYSSLAGILFNNNQTMIIRCPEGKSGSYTIPASVTNIGESAFFACSRLTGITIPASVTSIGDYAFKGCSSLTGIAIPAGVASIGNEALSYCSSLTAITVSNDNSVYSSINGVLFNKAQTSLIQYPGGKPGTYTIPIGVTSIGGYAFAFCSNLTSVTLLSCVTNIGDNAFDSCFGLNGAYFQGGAPGIGVSIFNLATNARVYYLPWMPTTTSWGTSFGGRPAEVWPGSQRIVIEVAGNQSGTIGVPFSLPLTVNFDTSSLPVTVTVAGLPSGLKYDATEKKITGVPLVAVTNKVVTISARNKVGDMAVPRTFAITVDPLQPWAYGTFNGWCMVDSRDVGAATMTVSKQGKITGKLSTGGLSYTFSAASFDMGSNSTTGFSVTASAKSGKSATMPLTLVVNSSISTNGPKCLSIADGWFAASPTGDPSIVMYRNVWSDADWKTNAVATSSNGFYNGYYTATLPQAPALNHAVDAFGSGYLAFTLSKGAVKTAGKLADGTAVSLSSVLLVDSTSLSNRYFTVLYSSPTAYKGGCLFGVVEFLMPAVTGAQIVVHSWDGVPFVWDNHNPLATSVASAGFSRRLDIVGGWYDKLGNLYRYYTNTTLSVDTGVSTPVPGTYIGSNWVNSVCWNPDGLILSPVVNTLGVMTGIAAPKAGTPVQVGEAWNYTANNTVGLTLGLTRATGLFRGSFNAWFDFVPPLDVTATTFPANVHTYKKVLCEGILTPGRADSGDGVAGRGFFLWSGNSQYLNTLGKSVTYTYKTSYDFIVLQSGL